MKMLAIIAALFTLLSTQAATRVSAEQATLIARAYAHGLPQDVIQYIETTIEDQLSGEPWVRHNGYSFMMHDAAGDCGFVIFVNFDGSINKDETFTDWSCM